MRKKYAIYIIFISFFHACTQGEKKAKQYKKTYSHLVTCSNVNMREEPSPESKSSGLVPENSKVTYIKETFYSEAIKIKNRQNPEKWYFVTYKTSNQEIKSGWVYAGCLDELPNYAHNSKIDNNIYLTNRHMILGFGSDCRFQSTDCELNCDCDCCVEDYYFMGNGNVICTSYCCCDNPEVFSIGKYEILKSKVICQFPNRHVEVDATASIEYGEYDKKEFVADVCANNILYFKCLDEEKSKLVFPIEYSFSKFLSDIKKSGTLQMLNSIIE